MIRATACGVALLIGASVAAETGDAIIEQAKTTLAQSLKDPDSAKFRDLVLVPPSGPGDAGIVCGYVNSRNSFGGYVGFQPFYVIGNMSDLRDREVGAWLNNHIIFDGVWEMCHGKSKHLPR